MGDKKRTTVTTIETHEVWIIRKVGPEPADEVATITPLETAQPAAAVSSLRELNNSSGTNEEKDYEEN